MRLPLIIGRIRILVGVTLPIGPRIRIMMVVIAVAVVVVVVMLRCTIVLWWLWWPSPSSIPSLVVMHGAIVRTLVRVASLVCHFEGEVVERYAQAILAGGISGKGKAIASCSCWRKRGG